MSKLLAQWAQVATLIVLVFGYFYTVRPVFQKERLSEEVAQLQIQRANSKQQLAGVHERVTRMQVTLANTQAANKNLETHNDALRKKQRRLLASAASADRKRVKAVKQLSIAKRNLGHVDTLYSKAAHHIFNENMQMYVGFTVERSMFFFSSDYSKKQIISKISAAVPDISLLVNKALDTFSPEGKAAGNHPLWLSDTFKNIVATFRKHFHERHSNIQIARVNAEVWTNAYLSQLAKTKSGRSKCIDKYWQGLAAHEKWSQSELTDVRSSKDYAKKQGAIFKRYCSVMGEYNVTKSFNDAWSKYYKEVLGRIMSIRQDITNNKQMAAFPKQLLQPPKFHGVWSPTAEDLKNGDRFEKR